MLVGTDGGFYVSYDKGARWDHLSHAGALGQFYHVAVDNRTPYRVYGGLQDNGSWGGPSRSRAVAGADQPGLGERELGRRVRLPRRSERPGDRVLREPGREHGPAEPPDRGCGRGSRPQARAGLEPFRFNWNTPFILSQHNSSIFYAAGNYVFRSLKQGDDLQAVSPEISLTKRGTGTALSESPRNPDIVWAGTDDGAVWVTKDGCKTWTNLTDKFKAAGLPGPRWVSTIEASRCGRGPVLRVFDAHRSNDDSAVRVRDRGLRRDLEVAQGEPADRLDAGAARGHRQPELALPGHGVRLLRVVNRGSAWTKINGDKGLPTVAVHEFAQPTTANDLVVATHGRSIWVLDVTALRQMTAEIVKGKTALFSPSPAIAWADQPGPVLPVGTGCTTGRTRRGGR